MSDNSKESWKNFKAIAAGTITGFLLAGLFLFFGRAFEDIYDEWWGLLIIVICFLVIPCFFAGYVTALISTNNDNRHVMITGTLLLVIALINSDFDVEGSLIEVIASVCLVYMITFIGGLVGLRKKKRKAISNTNSSPPGTPSQ